MKSRRSRALPCLGETLEQRVVLSGDWGGGNLLGSALNEIGVVTGPVVAPSSSSSSTSSQTSQLQQDIQALQTDLAKVAASSNLTIGDVSALAADSQAIAQSGSQIDVKSLDAAVNELAEALTGAKTTSGTSVTLSQAQTDFQAVFTGTNVSSTTVKTAFDDLSKAITDSGITKAELTKIASDQSAIQTDLSSLRGGGHFGDGFDVGGFGDGPGEGPFGGGSATGLLSGALSAIGVVTNPGDTVSGPVQGSWGGNSTQTSQPQTDLQTLQTELSSLASKSGVTVADLTSLAADSQAIAQSGSRIDIKSLDSAVNELAEAITGAKTSSDAKVTLSQAQTDFQAVFTGTNVSSTTVKTAFNDLSKAITDSGITSKDLSTVAADQAAIQTDLSNLGGGAQGSGGSGSGSGTTTGGNCGGSSSGSGSSSSGGSSSSSGSGSSSSSSSSGGNPTSTATDTPPLPTGSPSLTSTDSTDSTTTSSSSGQTSTSTGTRHHHAAHASVKAEVRVAKADVRARHSRA